jgi:hypothetical protein
LLPRFFEYGTYKHVRVELVLSPFKIGVKSSTVDCCRSSVFSEVFIASIVSSIAASNTECPVIV